MKTTLFWLCVHIIQIMYILHIIHICRNTKNMQFFTSERHIQDFPQVVWHTREMIYNKTFKPEIPLQSILITILCTPTGTRKILWMFLQNYKVWENKIAHKGWTLNWNKKEDIAHGTESRLCKSCLVNLSLWVPMSPSFGIR